MPCSAARAIAMVSGKALPCDLQHCNGHNTVQGVKKYRPTCMGLPPPSGRGAVRAVPGGG
eukprot:242738-Lingulodinium_polyedra.AAC.1